MWIARDKDGMLNLFRIKPVKEDEYWYVSELDGYTLDSEMHPEIKWEDGPLEVKLVTEKELDNIRFKAYEKGYDSCMLDINENGDY